VLLHELIHANIILITDKFIKDGGMNSMFYPLSHEHDVIKIEAGLYKRMTVIDNIKRRGLMKNQPLPEWHLFKPN